MVASPHSAGEQSSPDSPASLIQRLIAPHPDLGRRDERRQARFLAGLLLTFAVLSLLAAADLFGVPAYGVAAAWVAPASAVGFLLLYGLSRTRHVHWTAVGTIALLVTAIFSGLATVQAPGIPPGWLGFLAVPLILSFVLLSVRTTALVTAVTLVGVIVVPDYEPGVGLMDILTGPGLVMLALGATVLLAGRYRNLSEEDRRERIERQRHDLETIAENLGGYLLWLDSCGVTKYASKSHHRLIGYRSEDLVGRPLTDFAHIVHEDDAEKVHDTFVEALKSRAPTEFRYRAHAVSGEQVWLETLVTVPEAEDAGAIVVTRDITERVQTEAVAQQADRVRSLSRLAGGIAHDFNNALTAILGNATAAQARTSPDSDVFRNLDAIAGAARRAGNLTQELMAYAGRGGTQGGVLDLGELVSDSHDLLVAATPPHVRVDIKVDSDAPNVVADRSALQQVLVDLVINGGESIPAPPEPVRHAAVVATSSTEFGPDPFADSPNGVTTNGGSDRGSEGVVSIRVSWRIVTDEAADGWVAETPPEPGLYAALVVSDTGRGIPHGKLSEIFDPYFTTKEDRRGLGLSTALGIVHAHGGAMRLSTGPRGTEATVLIPGTDEPATAEPEATESAATEGIAPEPEVSDAVPPDGGRETAGTVLVVDDEAPVRDAVVDILSLQGVDVLTAASGQEAIELYQKHRDAIDLVILDLQMPGMDGEAVLAKLRAYDPEARVVLSSGYAESDVRERLGDLRPDGFLQKPYDVDGLVGMVI